MEPPKEEEKEEVEKEEAAPPPTQEKEVSTPFAYLVTVSSTQYSVELKPYQLHFVRRYPPQCYCFISDRNTHLYQVAARGDGVEGEGGGGGGGGSYCFGG